MTQVHKVGGKEGFFSLQSLGREDTLVFDLL